jgi:hypothetical protein
VNWVTADLQRHNTRQQVPFLELVGFCRPTFPFHSSSSLSLSRVAVMSFQDIETGLSGTALNQTQSPQSAEDAAFYTLQQSLSLQVFKMNANVQGILKLVDQLGTTKDSATLRKSLCVLCCFL